MSDEWRTNPARHYVLRNVHDRSLFWNYLTGYGCLCTADRYTQEEMHEEGERPLQEGEWFNLHDLCKHLEGEEPLDEYGEQSVADALKNVLYFFSCNDDMLEELEGLAKSVQVLRDQVGTDNE